MPTLQQKIASSFLEKLARQESVGPEKTEKLRELLASGKKLKPEDFLKIFAEPDGGDVK